MTRTTCKPATPLLVAVVQDGGVSNSVVIKDATGDVIARMDGLSRDGSVAAYLVHAANSYPKLVEALRALLAKDTFKPVCIRDADALLCELGELK